MKVAAGVDIGGTNIVCGLVDETGKLINKMKYPTAPERGPRSILESIHFTIEQLREDAGIASEDLMTVGIGVPGFVDPETGISLRAVNLRWEQVPVVSQLNEMINKPIFIDNDVRMYAYGEVAAGAGRNYNYVLVITLGTGLASALVHRGELYYGHRFMAGEIGHVPIENVNFQCNCGGIGCLETVVSAAGIARQAQARLERGESSLLRSWFSDVTQIRANDVSRACEAGDALSRDILDQTGRILGRALAWAVPIISPDAIVIGGGGALAGDLIFEPMKQELYSRLLQTFQDQVVIKTAELNDDAGVVGSALRAMHRHRFLNDKT